MGWIDVFSANEHAQIFCMQIGYSQITQCFALNRIYSSQNNKSDFEASLNWIKLQESAVSHQTALQFNYIKKPKEHVRT